MNYEQRQEIEQRIVRHLLHEAKKIGYECIAVDNGGEIDEIATCTTEAEVMAEAFATDLATLHFHKQLTPKQGMSMVVFIVLGNDGYDVINDYSAPAAENSYGWNELMERVNDYAEAQDTRGD